MAQHHMAALFAFIALRLSCVHGNKGAFGSDRLGHATTAFTQDVYIGVVPQLERDAAAKIANIVFSGSLGP